MEVNTGFFEGFGEVLRSWTDTGPIFLPGLTMSLDNCLKLSEQGLAGRSKISEIVFFSLRGRGWEFEDFSWLVDWSS